MAVERSTWEQEHWQQLQDLFHLAECVAPGDRTRVLQEASDSPQLIQYVLNMLEIGAPVEAAPRTPVSPSLGSAVGARIGPYVLLRHLGTGGLGSVYGAERVFGGAIQRCAVKILGLHADHAGFRARFLQEQQVLTNLVHPHITRFLDAGFSENGQPYLVMEYVDGSDLLTYCDAERLNIAERLALFLHVCDAVAYAHRNLTVHLDLKPSNALVSTDGVVKLLDFGTARILSTHESSATIPLATPAYASPEQLRNDPVNTSSDVYSLGVMLFELLSGKRPYGASSTAMLLDHALREVEAPSLAFAQITPEAAAQRSTTPDKLAKVLRGELAVVVGRCLRALPNERYSSVDALVSDLQRYLQNRPVLARKQTVSYRLRKFVGRNVWSVSAATLAIAGVIGSLTYAALRQHEALQNAQRAVQMQAFMSQLFKLANPDYTGRPEATVPQFLRLGALVLPQLLPNPADRRAAQLRLAESMYNAGANQDAERLLQPLIPQAQQAHDLPVEVEAEAYAGVIAYDAGDVARGEALTRAALNQVQSRTIPAETRIRAELFYAHNREEEGYRTPENLRLTQNAVTEARAVHLPPHELAYALTNLAGLLGPRGDLDGQERLMHEALTIYQSEPWAVCDQAEASSGLALIDNQRRAFDASLQHAREAYLSQVRCSGEGSRRALERHTYVAAALISQGKSAEAIPMLEEDLPRWTGLVGPDSDQLTTPLLFLTRAYNSTGRFAQATETASHLVRVEQPRINPLSAQMGICQLVWAQALAGEHKTAEALVHATLADKAFQTEASKAPGTMHNAKTAHDLLLKLKAEG